MANLQAPVLCIDGPSGSGKGTVTQLVANRLGWAILDSGALYRLTAISGMRSDIDFGDEAGLASLAATLDCEFKASEDGEPVRVFLGGEDVTSELRLETTGNNASKVAVLPKVREALLQRQRDFQQLPGLVADGRDMGTVVFPEAPFKVFLTASAQARAERRHQQLKAQGEDVKIATLLQEIEARDARDMGRKAAPLKAADDAIIIDTTEFSIEQVLEKVLSLVHPQ
ncbi:cytidylate kinase [Oleiphilus sp. HI0071]|nr:cytidylate kinase [Oleiphilus sp. HI0065]KZY80530.1 cytidylate kinase [Oleiphilus sp. HI0071]KZY99761.1 cytidylate kinase [Oleiphilus sp. HI0073]KZZ14171.1 cytidylate kinase [Oleiphilus sp. HI0079]KZZ42474.1 cytidylate kinase [Oleiphilus sp. HI0118]KZZ48259.1 cytidylate kinase [Oleiphilus sp. HI0122]KZZ78570.1 cytidylate kinase [Oleiphilus sp. HI0133]